jgi:hypothetical protein
MSAEHEKRRVPEPGELIFLPRSSWTPAFLAFALAVVVCGVYAEGFMLRGWVYSLIGAAAALLFLRALIQGAVRDFYRPPRRQHVRGAVLPVETIQPPKRG